MKFLILLFLAFPVFGYDQFEGYDLSNPYPTVNDWYHVEDHRREDMRDAEERQRYDEWDNFNPYTRGFLIELDD